MVSLGLYAVGKVRQQKLTVSLQAQEGAGASSQGNRPRGCLHPTILSLFCPCNGPQRVSLLFFPSAPCEVGAAFAPRKPALPCPVHPLPLCPPPASDEPRSALQPPPSGSRPPLPHTCGQDRFLSCPHRAGRRQELTRLQPLVSHFRKPTSGRWTAESQRPPRSSSPREGGTQLGGDTRADLGRPSESGAGDIVRGSRDPGASLQEEIGRESSPCQPPPKSDPRATLLLSSLFLSVRAALQTLRGRACLE